MFKASRCWSSGLQGRLQDYIIWQQWFAGKRSRAQPDGVAKQVYRGEISQYSRLQSNSAQNTLFSVAIITIKRKFFFAHTSSAPLSNVVKLI